MTDDRYQEIKRCFETVMELSEPERTSALNDLCGLDHALFEEVQALLRAAGSESSLDSLLEEPPRPRGLPERVAGYRILGVAGRGGMGTVYEAEQDVPRRTVALKIVDHERSSSEVLQRLRREAETLGRLAHPGIAQIYDAGSFDDGIAERPYFAMEFVRGRALIEYASEQALDDRARLELFTSVCDAVAYAHEQGVVHRDLKPANILVDTHGKPKVLDFGVARITQDDASQVTLTTSPGQIVGTLPYMSPEQATGEPGSADERADVYGLGVILHELLTGKLPISMSGRTVQDAIRSLMEEDPTPIGTWRATLRGDLELIVSKSLSKERERRYQSAEALASDVRRYLADEPIVARPPTLLYQLSKFTRRNRGVMVGALVGTLVAFSSLTVALIHSVGKSRDLAKSEARALRRADRSAIAAAAAALELGEVSLASQHLERVPEANRSWEWRHFASRLDTASGLLDLQEPVAAFALDDAGNLVVATASGRLLRWSLVGRRVVAEQDLGRTLPVAKPGAFLPPVRCTLDDHGRFLAVVDRNRVTLWDARKGEVILESSLPAGADRVALGPSASLGALAGPGGLWRWDLDSGDIRQIDDVERDCLDLSEDGLLMALDHDHDRGSCAVYDLETGVEVFPFEQWQRAYEIELLPGGESALLARADDKKPVRLVKRDGTELSFVGHSLTPRAVDWSPLGQTFVSGGDDRVVLVWSLEQLERPLRELHGHTELITEVEIDRSGRWVAALAGTTLRCWDLSVAPDPLTLEHPHAVYTVDFLESGELLSSDWKGLFRRWSPSGELLREQRDVPAGSRLARSADGKRFVRQQWEYLAVLDEDLHLVKRRPLKLKLTDVALSTDGRRAATRHRHAIYVLSVPDLDILFQYDLDPETRPKDNRFGAIAFSPSNNEVIAQDESGDLVIWDVLTGQVVGRLVGQGGRISRMAYSRDGTRLACGSTDGTTWVWDYARKEVVARLERHTSRVYALAFSPDMKRLATGSNDTTVRLWDLEDGQQVGLFSENTDFVYDLAFSPDGMRLAGASGDGTIHVWDSVPRHQR